MRDIRLDVARGVLIVCVAVGHLLERSYGWRGGVQELTLTALYAFHMPAFVFLTGVVAKPTGTRRRVLGLASVLVCFQAAFVGFLYVTGHPLDTWYQPYWILWYVMAMIWWELMVPFIKHWPRISLGIAIAAALLAGFVPVDGDWFSYQRTLVFLPFFVAGCAWGKTIMARLRDLNRGGKALIVAGFAAGVAVIFALNPSQKWLFHSSTYAQLDADGIGGTALRAGLLVVGALGTAAIIALVTQTGDALAWLGQRTLPVFLFHGFAVLLYAWIVIPRIQDAPGSVLLVTNTVVGVIVALLLATKPTVKLAGFVRGLPMRAGLVRVPAH